MLYKTLKQAFKNLMLRKGRSVLTGLGVMIGTATIVVVVGIGMGAQAEIEEQYSNMSVTTIFVNATKMDGGGMSKLSESDAAIILEKSKYIEVAVPQKEGKTNISSEEATEQFSVVGTNQDFQKALNVEMLNGRFLNELDGEDKNRVVVLGYSVAEELYDEVGKNIIGETVKIERKDYEVIGVIDYRGGSTGKVSIDDSVFAPFETAERYILSKTAKLSLNLQATSVEVLYDAMDEVQEILRQEHNLKIADVDDFKIRDMGTTVSAAVSSSRTMTYLLGSVALIVLVVGGIGIMNIMFVSVQERTKEIGVRKAVGAKGSHISPQFLAEAIVLCFFSAAIGEIIAFGVFKILARTDFSVLPVLWGYGLALLSSMCIGVFFGYYPAKKASDMNPIDALRHE